MTAIAFFGRIAMIKFHIAGGKFRKTNGNHYWTSWFYLSYIKGRKINLKVAKIKRRELWKVIFTVYKIASIKIKIKNNKSNINLISSRLL